MSMGRVPTEMRPGPPRDQWGRVAGAGGFAGSKRQEPVFSGAAVEGIGDAFAVREQRRRAEDVGRRAQDERAVDAPGERPRDVRLAGGERAAADPLLEEGGPGAE